MGRGGRGRRERERKQGPKERRREGNVATMPRQLSNKEGREEGE